MIKVRQQKGFTLIELVIVLAIAALILAGILLAVSGAQKSRRDAQRKNDSGRIVANIETYASNHGGVYPATGAAPAAVYANMKDPKTGAAYNQVGTIALVASGTAGDFAYTVGAAGITACDGTTGMTGARQFRVDMKLESGDTACLDTN